MYNSLEMQQSAQVNGNWPHSHLNGGIHLMLKSLLPDISGKSSDIKPDNLKNQQ